MSQGPLLTDLPNEIFIKILENVSFFDLFNLEQVNKRLQEIVLKRVWPKKDTFSYEAKTLFSELHPASTNKVKSRIFYRKPIIAVKTMEAVFFRTNIRHLDLSIFSSTVKKDICSLLSMTPQLQTLNLSLINLDKSDLLNIAKFCPLLEEASFVISFKNEECEEGLQQIFIKCPNIKYLNIADNVYLNGESFSHIPTQLKYLDIASCPSITSEAMNNLFIRKSSLETVILCSFFFEGNTINLLNKLTKLKYLELMYLNGNFLDFSTLKELEMLGLSYEDGGSVNIESLQTLENCQKLKALSIDFSYGKNDKIVLETLKNFIALKYCHFNRCVNLNALTIFVHVNQIKYLAISGYGVIEQKTLRSLLTECVSLTHLELFYGTSLNYETLSDVLNEECPQRQNILKFVIPKPPTELLLCKWCEIIPNDKTGWRLFGHFTDVKVQFHNQKPA